MSIKPSLVLDILRDILETEEMGGKNYESRFELNDWQGWDETRHSSSSEVRPELRERDRHLLYMRNLRYVEFGTEISPDGGEDFFGGLVKVTPAGVQYYQEHRMGWLRKQWKALCNNILTIFVALAISWAIYWWGPPAAAPNDQGSNETVEQKQ